MPTPVSFNGHAINDGTSYAALMVEGDFGLPAVNANLVERQARWPILSGVRRPGARKTVRIFVVNQANIPALRAQLMRWLDPEDETPKAFIVSTDGRQQYVMAVCQALDHNKGGQGQIFVATLPVHGDVRWRKTAATEQVWNITASGQTVAVTNAGEDDAYPILKIKPTAAKEGGYSYRRQLFVRWQVDKAARSYPVDITNGSLNTATLIADTGRSVQINQGGGINNSVTTITYDNPTGILPSSGLAYVDSEQISYTGKSPTQLTGVTRGVNGTTAASHADNAVITASKAQADASDYRVLVNGVEVNRWLDGFGTSTTKTWANLDFRPAVTLTTTAAIAATGSVDTIDFNESIRELPGAGMLVIDSECFVYTGKNTALQRVTGVTRATKGTSMAGHLAGATAWWYQQDIQIIYGNPTATAPTVDDDYKPMFNLATSDNTSWQYAEFGEGDLSGDVNPGPTNRPGAWQRQLAAFDPVHTVIDFYTADRYTYATPWQEIGIHLETVLKTTVGMARWILYNPCGITVFDTTDGEKYCYLAPATEWYAAIQSSANGTGWNTEYSIPAPSAADTWQLWTRNETITADMTWVGLMLRIPSAEGAKDIRRIEVYEVGITLNSSNTPVVTIGSEEGNYSLNATITNNTTGKAIELDFVMGLNEELEVDTDAKTVIYLKDGSSQFQALTVVGGARKDWLALQPGSNTLQFDDAGTAGLTITIEYEERFY